MAYRARPDANRRVVITMPRSREAVFYIAGGVVVFGLFAYAMSGGTRLRCERSTDQCTLVTWRGAEVLGSSEPIALSRIQGAEVAHKRDTDGDPMRALFLVVDRERRMVSGGWQNFGFAEMDAWSAEVNRFVLDPSRPRLDALRSGAFAVWLWGLASSSAILAWIVRRPRVVIDTKREAVEVRRSLLSRSVQLPLRQVRCAEVQPIVGRERHKQASRVQLVMADGSTVVAATEVRFSPDEQERFAAAINAALPE